MCDPEQIEDWLEMAEVLIQEADSTTTIEGSPHKMVAPTVDNDLIGTIQRMVNIRQNDLEDGTFLKTKEEPVRHQPEEVNAHDLWDHFTKMLANLEKKYKIKDKFHFLVQCLKNHPLVGFFIGCLVAAGSLPVTLFCGFALTTVGFMIIIFLAIAGSILVFSGVVLFGSLVGVAIVAGGVTVVVAMGWYGGIVVSNILQGNNEHANKLHRIASHLYELNNTQKMKRNQQGRETTKLPV